MTKTDHFASVWPRSRDNANRIRHIVPNQCAAQRSSSAGHHPLGYGTRFPFSTFFSTPSPPFSHRPAQLHFLTLENRFCTISKRIFFSLARALTRCFNLCVRARTNTHAHTQ